MEATILYGIFQAGLSRSPLGSGLVSPALSGMFLFSAGSIFGYYIILKARSLKIIFQSQPKAS